MTAVESRVRELRARLAPGTMLRDGLERILRGRTGALIVLGNNESVHRISTGGFELDTPFTATGLRELAKMDGAIILSPSCERIVGAGVHLMPDPDLPTMETGTRHRTADRVAQQTTCPVITVSASMNTIALFLENRRFPVEAPGAILDRANLALQTLERYRAGLMQVLTRLSTLEVQDQVTVRDVVHIGQRLEMVRRLEDETQGYVAELGTDGRLLGLQLTEVDSGVTSLTALLTADYRPVGEEEGAFGFARLAQLPDSDLVDVAAAARVIGFSDPLDSPLSVRGYRQLAGLQRLPSTVAGRLIQHFGGLQGILGASSADLLGVEGVGDHRARMIRAFLTQMAENVFARPIS